MAPHPDGLRAGIDFGFYNLGSSVDSDSEGKPGPDGQVNEVLVLRAEWDTEVMALLQDTSISVGNFWMRGESLMWPTSVAYREGTIELHEYDNGFSLQYVDHRSEYLFPTSAGSSTVNSDPDVPEALVAPRLFGDGSASDWAVWLVGTDGDLLGVSIISNNEPSSCPLTHLYLFSLRDGTIRSCTEFRSGRYILTTTASADDGEAWLEEVRLPPSGPLELGECTEFAGDLATLVAMNTR